MINLFIYWCFFFSFQEQYLLEPNKVGELEVGGYVESIYFIFDKDKETGFVDRYFEATFSPAIAVKKKDELLFFANLDCDKIYSFEVVSSRYSTSKGIRVGSILGNLKKEYTISSIENQEGILYAIVEDLGMSFSLETMSVIEKGIDINQRLSIDKIPEDVIITSIIIY